MSSKQWPFYPERISDVINQGEIAFIECGCAEKLKMPVALLEPSEIGESGKVLRTYRISTINPQFRFSEFCKLLRDDKECPGGEQTCKSWDDKVARDFFNGELRPEQDRTGLHFPCYMGLVDMIAPVVVRGRTIAVLFSCQRRPETEQALGELRANIAKCGKKRGFRDIRAGRSVKEKLEKLVDELEPYRDEQLLALEQQAEHIAKQAETQMNLIKSSREAVFRRRLVTGLRGIPKTSQELDQTTEKIANLIRDYLGVSYVVFLGPSQTEGKTLLAKAVSKGAPEICRELRFDWKTAVRDNPFVLDRWDLASDWVRCIREGIGKQYDKLASAGLGCFIPFQLSGGPRGALCLGPSSENIDLGSEARFLRTLALVVCGEYLGRQQRLELEEATSNWQKTATTFEKKSQAWKDIAALIFHRVRGSLNPVTTGCDVIEECVEKMRLQSENQHSELVARVKDQVKLMRREAFSLADMAKETFDTLSGHVKAGERGFVIRDLYLLVRESVEIYLEYAHEKLVDIVLDRSLENLPRAELRPPSISILLHNLLDNAVKYSDEDRYVVIRGGTVGRETAFIEIENYGIGIPRSDRERIFESRYRGKFRPSWKCVQEGDGLGLYEARQHVLEHGGTITCRSSRGNDEPSEHDFLGFKTVFRVELPILQSTVEENRGE